AMGTYYVLAEVDATKVVAEFYETNNVTFRAVQVGPDLVVSSLTVPAAGGDVVSVSDTTTNQGTVNVGPSVTRVYLSADALLDSADTLLQQSRSVAALPAGASDSGTTLLTIPPNTPTGLRYIIAKADADNTIAETQETNNTLSRPIQIGSDLTITAFTAPSKV